MNCQSCNTRIDYRFLTKCTHCDADLGPAEAPAKHTPTDVRLAEKNFTALHGVINVAYLVFTSVAGMITGAVVVYFVGAVVYLAVFGHGSGNSSEDCARGTAIGILLVLLGGFLGTLSGTVFAARNLPYKGAATNH